MRPTPPTTFVGRVRELEELGDAVRSGDPAVIVVRGVAGVGKTRLVRELLARSNVPSLWVRCWDDSTPMWCWSEVATGLGADPGWTDAGDRLQQFTALRRALHAKGPIVIGVDDIHLADDASLLFARFLARTAGGSGLVVVATARQGADEANAPVLDDLLADSFDLVVAPLDAHDARAMLAVGRASSDDSSTDVDAVLTLAQGLPLALERAGRELRHGAAIELSASVRRAVSALDGSTRRVLGAVALRSAPCAPAEVSVVTGLATRDVLDAIDAAARAGIVHSGHDTITFVHDLVRRAVEEATPPHERVELHRSWWNLSLNGDPGWLPTAALHATAVAAVDPSMVGEAIDLWFRVAEQHRRAGALEEALEAADAAAALATRATLSFSAPRRVEHADAALRAGRLTRARELYLSAVDAAERDHDLQAFADAAVGLGGIWLQEHRDDHVAAAIEAVQRRALAAVESIDEMRALRLRTRLAAESAYRTRRVDELLELLDENRRMAPPLQIAEALSLTIHATLGPDHTAERLAWVEEMTRTAAVAGDAMMLLHAQCWTTAAMMLAGAPGAGRERRNLELRCTTLRCASLQFIVDAMGVGDLITAGHFDAAERAAAECFEKGQAVGDADAWNYYAAHLALIRWFQGRHHELVEFAQEAALAPSLVPGERALSLTAALFTLDAGDRAAADHMVLLHRQAPHPHDFQQSTWLVAMFATARLARLLADPDLGADVARRLEPHVGLPVVLSLGVADLGPVDWPLGVALAAAGELHAAEQHLRTAHELAMRRNHSPAAILIEADLAEVLEELGDHDEALARLRSAAARAADSAMNAWSERWTALAVRWGEAADARAAGAAECVRFERLEQGLWRCSLVRGARPVAAVTVRETVGVRHLAALCSAPGVEISASRLAYLADTFQSSHDVLDAQAIDELRARIGELRQRIDAGEPPRERWEDELDAVTGELLAATGLGASRPFADPGERARTAVRKAITRAIERLDDDDIAAHLSAHVRTGHRCCYEPDRTTTAAG